MSDLESATPHRTPLAVHARTTHAAITFQLVTDSDHKFTDERRVIPSSPPRACRAHLRITAGGDGVLYAVHGVTSQISAVVNSVPDICTVLQEQCAYWRSGPRRLLHPQLCPLPVGAEARRFVPATW
ncbi:hypothetical protein EVAR_58250_1 [Eumeta japonica]|uniref:Uncharacterized protein n=1 Tax=Eumeta variegata TaxID=151549 RepID=A0A4C2AGZ6_EUMVA|nr:hypothetical protein EVAR_58250_1 [Eumeta japonica]